jgi:hypothetical protein
MLRLLSDGLAETGRYDIETQFGYAGRWTPPVSSRRRSAPGPTCARRGSAMALVALLAGLGAVARRAIDADARSWRRFASPSRRMPIVGHRWRSHDR